MPTIFITGASSGIGKETAKLFAQKGWHVIATMRNLQRAGELGEMENISILPLDLTNPNQIRDTCAKALEEYDVDVLFNNAGYGIMAPFERLSEEAIREVFDADVIGTMLVTQQFIPHFKARKAGAILTTTSLAGIIALPRDGAYGAAKRAQQGMLESLYYELKPFGIAVKAIIPGATKTNFQTPVNDRVGYEQAAQRQHEYLKNGHEAFPGPEEAAQTVWTAIHDGKDQINYPADHICQELYDQYIQMGMEAFKSYFYDILYSQREQS